MPLHIFEPRYKEMIGECLANNSAFGVVKVLKNGIAGIGCTAENIVVTRKFPDGRMDILTDGRRRFEVIALDRERSFLRGEVVFLDDEPGVALELDRSRAIALHADVLALAGAKPDLSGAEESQLSYVLAGSLPLDLDFKQKLLAMRSEAERMPALAEYLQKILPNLRRVAQARSRSGGNGHVH